jgi:hypothetical protein
MTIANKPDEAQLLADVKSARENGEVVSATLTTDERVFARITDGIYREPASALRELIANAYDADATEVWVDTDAPRFSRIIVRDNGHGLSEEALVHVICHIGGSLKRTKKGDRFNVVSKKDPFLSPAGRKLIGKLGIGLFSVSQLTHHLTIVTKVKGEAVRRVCDILLVPQSDASPPKSEDGDDIYVTGRALIKTIPAEDVDSQGTEITLLDIRPFVRESLQSQALWSAISGEPGEESEDGFNDSGEALSSETPESQKGTAAVSDLDEFYEKPPTPSFHIGHVSRMDNENLLVAPCLPWTAEDSSTQKFKNLVAGVRALASETSERIRLGEVLDTYLRTIWTLSLSMPLPYVNGSPLRLTCESKIPIFAITNKATRARAQEIELQPSETIAEKLGFTGDESDPALPFTVLVDDVELSRPLDFFALTHDASSIPPLMFVGKMKADLSSISADYNGGPLEFEAYFYWQPKIVPADHNGIMVRINGASGILFDDHFFKYQISELTRLRQITAEVYVKQGLDAALNIDRESFNIAHTHYQVLKRWVHHALRQVMSAQKRVTSGANKVKLEGGLNDAVLELARIIKPSGNDKTSRTEISFSDTPIMRALQDGLVFDRATVFGPRSGKRLVTKTDKLNEELLEQQIKAVAAVLQDYGVFDALGEQARDELLRKIVAIFSVDIRK